MERPENKRGVPSVFTCVDGTEVKTKEEWFLKRRPELLELFRREEYGRLPDMKDVELHFRVADVREGDDIMAGGAERKTVEVEAVRKGRSFIFNFVLFVPKGLKKPVPAFVLVCNRGIKDCDPARHMLSSFYPAETIISRGYACAAFRTQEVAPDYEDGFTTGFHRLFPEYAAPGVHLAKARGSRVPNEYFLHRFQTGKNNTLLLLKKIKVAFRMFLQNGLKRFFSRHDSHGKQPRFVLSKPGCHAWRHIQTGLKFPLLPVPPNNAATGGNGASGRCLRGRRCIFQKAVQKITCDIVIEG